MLGKTHISAALASAAIISFKCKIPMNPLIMSGAMIGGIIPDIDLRNSMVSKYIKTKFIYTSLILLSSLLVASFYFKSQFILYKYHFKLIGLFLLLVSACFSKFTGHRMYSHSILGLSIFSYGIYIIYKPLCMWFIIGYISHILIDLLNFQGEALLFPFKGSYSFKICKSSGIVNNLMLVTCSLCFIVFTLKT